MSRPAHRRVEITAIPDAPSLLAVIVTVDPSDTAVTTPFAETVAMAGN